MDPDSASRARHARRVAAQLGVECLVERRPPASSGDGVEAAARRERYAFLRRCRAARRLGWIAVGHHRDDQIATVLMRLLFGSGLIGLGGMRPVEDDLVRPLIELERSRLEAVLAAEGIATVADPGNDDLRRPRNRIDASLAPWLEGQPGASRQLLAAAAAAHAAGDALRARLSRALAIQPGDATSKARLRLETLRGLPPALRPYALDALRRAAGARYPAPEGARRELDRQLGSGRTIGCHCGGGWSWRSRGEWLEMSRPSAGETHGGAVRDGEVKEFSYTLRVPGEVSIPEVGLTLHLKEAVQAPWMFKGSKSRAAMSLPLEVGQQVLIRNRRPGDRVRPLGCTHERKLKDVLIDRHVERAQRDALPLLVVEGKIAWIPGVTIDETFRLDGNRSTWIAELTPMRAQQP